MADGFNLDTEVKRLQEINKEREKLYSEAKRIVEALKGVQHSSSATAGQKSKIRNAIKPYTRQRKS
jgi:pantothenate kinase type III